MSTATMSYDVLFVGGGVIGLTAAYELRRKTTGPSDGPRVAVLDPGPGHGQASWAGAGILPPANPQFGATPMDRLRGHSFEEYPRLAAEIQQLTGVDTEFQRCGGSELARTAEEVAELEHATRVWREQGIRFERLDARSLRQLEPDVTIPADAFAAYWLPDYGQVRNPRLLRGLAAGCRAVGVDVFPSAEVAALRMQGDRCEGATCRDGRAFTAAVTVVTAGAWAGRLLAAAGTPLEVYPVRGQIVAYEAGASGVAARHVLLHGKRYFVPRRDGLLLAGATEEHAGFDAVVSPEGHASLREFAAGWFEGLRGVEPRHAWAGLRPGCWRPLPVIGPVPGRQRLWVATGHFRQGLQNAPGTARLLADWLDGKPSFARPADFGPNASEDGYRPAFVS